MAAKKAPQRTDQQQLLEQYTPLVRAIAGGFHGRVPRHVLREDLIAAGMSGLWDAIRKAQPDKSASFEWYARVRIRGAIIDQLRSEDYLPRRARLRENPPTILHLGDMAEPDQDRTLAADVDAESVLLKRETHDELMLAVNGLTPRTRDVIYAQLAGEKMRAIAARLRVTEPRICQIRAIAIRVLKANKRLMQTK